MAVAVVLAIILFAISQDVLLSQDTSGWTSIQITLAFTLGTALLIAVVVMIFKAVTGSRG